MPLAILILFPLLILTVCLSSLFEKRKAQLLAIILMIVLIVMQLISIYFSGGFVDYQFFVNLNINDIIEGLFIFKRQTVLIILVFFSLLFFLYRVALMVKRHICVQWRLIAALLSVVAISYPKGPIHRIIEIYQITSAQRLPFNAALTQLNMQNLPMKTQLNSQAGKNIVVISLESFEQNFLKLANITPNLNQLSREYLFFPKMPMCTGSTWTTASLYTYMTGMPFLVGGLHTPPLSEVKKTKLVSLGDVLQQAGYQTRYIIGNPSFSAIGHIIGLFGIEILSEKSYLGEYPKAPFGLYDKDIFDIARRQVNELSKQSRPFALFISTISTHAPDGFYDARMEAVISPKDDNISFAAASLDYQLGKFIAQLKEQGLLDNTVFYVFPDHLMMGGGTRIIQRLSQHERLLYLLTNATEQDLRKKTDQQIYQIDLPRLILNGAQVKTNAQFLADYLSLVAVDKCVFIDKNKRAIATLNRSAQE